MWAMRLGVAGCVPAGDYAAARCYCKLPARRTSSLPEQRYLEVRLTGDDGEARHLADDSFVRQIPNVRTAFGSLICPAVRLRPSPLSGVCWRHEEETGNPAELMNTGGFFARIGREFRSVAPRTAMNEAEAMRRPANMQR